MYGKGSLAATGASLTILGVSMSLSTWAALIVLLIIGGALVYRQANRNKRYAPAAQTTSTTQGPWGNDS